jgi:thymidylate synthase
MNSLDRQYQELLLDIMHNGVHKQTRNGKTVSLFGKQIRHKMKDGFPLLTTKKMYWKGIVTELIWFLRGDTNIKFLVDNGCHIWDGDAYKNYLTKGAELNEQTGGVPDFYSKEEFINKIKTDFKFAEKWGDLGPVYGKQWRGWKGEYVDKSAELGVYTAWVPERIDQIAKLINDLKTNPDSRRLMVNAWNVGELDQMTLPPCHYGFQVYTRELSHDERFEIYKKICGRDLQPQITGINFKQFHFDEYNVPKRAISLMWNQRSVDTFLGLPFNIASYGLLLEILAKMTNMVPDELIGNLGDVHLYEEHGSQAREQITRQPYQLPKLFINDEFWAKVDDVKDFNVSAEILSMLVEDFQIEDYESHPTIKAPLIN